MGRRVNQVESDSCFDFAVENENDAIQIESKQIESNEGMNFSCAGRWMRPNRRLVGNGRRNSASNLFLD